MLRPLLAVAFVGALTLPASGGSTPGLPELTAKVTARSVSLTTSQGQRVDRLRPNTYRFIVKDLTSKQNFHLIGPSLNRRTRVPAKVTTTWTIYLRPGTYTYRSDRRPNLSATFTVEPGPPPA
jgi:hypothetical protein